MKRSRLIAALVAAPLVAAAGLAVGTSVGAAPARPATAAAPAAEHGPAARGMHKIATVHLAAAATADTAPPPGCDLWVSDPRLLDGNHRAVESEVTCNQQAWYLDLTLQMINKDGAIDPHVSKRVIVRDSTSIQLQQAEDPDPCSGSTQVRARASIYGEFGPNHEAIGATAETNYITLTCP
jgi:hypothetical protein